VFDRHCAGNSKQNIDEQRRGKSPERHRSGHCRKLRKAGHY
jgi:hypothetical protein